MGIFRSIGVAGSAAAILFSATVAFAEEKPTNIRMGEPGKNPAGMYRLMGASTTATTTRGEIREAAHDRLQVVREEMQDRMKEQRDKAQQRLADIKDKAKQQMAERLAKQFENLNATWTDHFIKVLDRLDAIVLKIQNRTNIAAGNGKDVGTATAAIASAKTAIASARAAVTEQAGKVYAIDPSAIPVTTSTTTPSGQDELVRGLRTSFKNLHSALFKDLFALRDGPITDARKAVQNALQVLAAIVGNDEGSATSTSARSDQ